MLSSLIDESHWKDYNRKSLVFLLFRGTEQKLIIEVELESVNVCPAPLQPALDFAHSQPLPRPAHQGRDQVLQVFPPPSEGFSHGLGQ